MRILLAGSSGFVGSALILALKKLNHQVVRLLRKREQADEEIIVWDPISGKCNIHDFESFDAVINLAGESIMGRWTANKKKKIRESRVVSTQNLCHCLSKVDHKPSVFINASAVGFYGDRGSELLTEESPPGNNFLAFVCQEWEEAALLAESFGARVVLTRFGMILSTCGGALKQMLPAFRMGLGGVLGKGDQFISWVTLEDVIKIILLSLEVSSLQGPVNVGSPNPVTNYEFTKTLGKVLKRPTIFPMPESLLRIVFGEMAEELLLSSAKMTPKKLLDEGYEFIDPQLEQALIHMLKDKK